MIAGICLQIGDVRASEDGSPLIIHSASSCTNPASYSRVFDKHIFPYWDADPPEPRLTRKPYKHPDDPSVYVRDGGLLYWVSATVKLHCHHFQVSLDIAKYQMLDTLHSQVQGQLDLRMLLRLAPSCL
jgi:hypothetical protein